MDAADNLLSQPYHRRDYCALSGWEKIVTSVFPFCSCQCPHYIANNDFYRAKVESSGAPKIRLVSFSSAVRLRLESMIE